MRSELERDNERANMELVLDRVKTVVQFQGRSRAAIYNDIKDGTFPKPVKIGERVAVWPRHEHQAIAAARLAGKSDDDIKRLVAELVAQRGAAK